MRSAVTTDPARVRWQVLMALRSLDEAKSRLDVPVPLRSRLAMAMAMDAVETARHCPLVSAVHVICPDPAVVRSLSWLGARVLADEPPGGLNVALGYGARIVQRGHHGQGLAIMVADLPAASADELTVALRAATAAGGHTVLADAEQTGTCLLTTPAGQPARPAFGFDSFARHKAMGAIPLGATQFTGLRRDVDTLDNLRVALTLGHARFTRHIVAPISRNLLPM